MRNGSFRLNIDMMSPIIFLSLLPAAIDFPHLHLSVDGSLLLVSIHLSVLLHKCVYLHKTANLLDFLTISDVFAVLLLHNVIIITYNLRIIKINKKVGQKMRKCMKMCGSTGCIWWAGVDLNIVCII